VAEYRLRLGDVTVIVKSDARARGPRFEAVVMDAGGRVLGRGRDYTEPGAVGLAVLAAGRAKEADDVD
jgi:hypothetical protein